MPLYIQIKSYKLINFVVREFASQKYLSMPRSGAQITEINDMGNVELRPTDDEDDTLNNEISSPQIIAVPHFDSYMACLQCKARIEPLTPPLGRCSKPYVAKIPLRYVPKPVNCSSDGPNLWLDFADVSCTLLDE